MTKPQPTQHRNHLLASLAPADLASLEPRLEPLTLELRRPIELPLQPITHVFFPSSGIVSVVAIDPRGRKIEVGVIGREGMTGVSVVLGSDRTTNETYVQMAGTGHRLAAAELRKTMQDSRSLQLCLLHYAQAFLVQMAYTALANGRATVEARLARWLLMAHDRADGDELALTHEFLALMLGVRRAGVTTSLSLLEAKTLISTARARIVVLDRAGLEELADGAYGVPEAEYRRLTGWRGKN